MQQGLKEILKKLSPLLLIFCIVLSGFSLIVYRHIAYEKFEGKHNEKIHNATARMVIGESIVSQISKLESLFYKLTIATNQEHQQVIFKASQKNLNNINDCLDILENGGSVSRDIPINLPGSNKTVINIHYRTNPTQQYVVEILELRPALVEIAEKMQVLGDITTHRNQILKNNSQKSSLVEEAKNIRNFIKTSEPLFGRVTENGYKLFVDGRERLKTLREEITKKREVDLRDEFFVALSVLCTVLILVGFALRQIFLDRETLKKKVMERTQELTLSNKNLHSQIQTSKKIEVHLRESENRMRDITRSMSDWIWEINAKGTYIYVSETVEKTLGYTAEEILGKTPFDFMPEKERIKLSNIFSTIASEATAIVNLENWNIDKNGKDICLLTNAVPILNNDGILLGYRGVDKDITSLKKLEDELLQSRKMESIGTLAGGIAHDFNNILTAIIGYAELIRYEVKAESSVHKDINQILASAKRATDLVKQILTFSRKADTKKIPLRPHVIITEAVKMLHSTFPTSAYITEDIDPDCGVILAAPTNIHQIIVNLCTNGLHALKDEKGTIYVSLQRKDLDETHLGNESLLSPGPFIALTVTDNGCGMEEELIDRIFDPYFTTKEISRGTGLGLAVIHGIVQDSKGFIQVKSTVGIGSSFTIYLPAIEEETAVIDESIQQDTSTGGKEHILVVDDEPLVLQVTQRQLETIGYKVTITESSEDALKQILLNPKKFDLLITDQTMPSFTGAELATAAMEIRADFPVILCTGHSEMISREKALKLGIKSYILKPVIGNELFKAVRSVLDKKK